MKKSSLLLPGLCFISIALNAQLTLSPSVIASGGGYHETDHMSISWTLGEVAVTTLAGDGIMLTQGFQQPFDIGVGYRPDQANWQIGVYPNPVRDELRIRFDIEQPGDFLLEVQDVTGRLIAQQKASVSPGDIILINTATYKSGVYFLRVLTSDHSQLQVTSLRKL